MSSELNFIAMVGDNIAQYALGGYLQLSILVSFVFLIVLLSSGIDFKYAFPLLLPVIAAYNIGGYLGSSGWLYNVILFAVAFIYAFTIIKLYGR